VFVNILNYPIWAEDIGGIRIGEKLETVIENLGEPQYYKIIIIPESGNVFEFLYYQQKNFLVVGEKKKVCFVGIKGNCPNKTKKGLGLGDTIKKAINIYGKAKKIQLGERSRIVFEKSDISVEGKVGTTKIERIFLGKLKLRKDF